MAYLASWFYVFGFVSILALGDIKASTWPDNLATTFPYPTRDPMNLTTANAKLRTTKTPITLSIGALKLFRLTNTGYSVEVRAINPSPTTSITGGILGETVYQLILANYFWSDSSTAPASNFIDSNGASIQVRAFFANVQYGSSFEIAKTRPGGLVGAVVNVQVEGYVNSTTFAPFAAELVKIQQPGTSIVTGALPLFLWFNEAFLDGSYYAYPGAYFNPSDVTKQYPATILEYPKSSQPGISIPQLNSFLALRSIRRAQLTNTVKPVPADRRPIVEVAGTAEIPLPLP